MDNNMQLAPNPSLWRGPSREERIEIPVIPEYETLTIEEFYEDVCHIETHIFTDPVLLDVLFAEIEKDKTCWLGLGAMSSVSTRYQNVAYEVYRRTDHVLSGERIHEVHLKYFVRLKQRLQQAILEKRLSPEGVEDFLWEKLEHYAWIRFYREVVLNFESEQWKKRVENENEDLEDSETEDEFPSAFAQRQLHQDRQRILTNMDDNELMIPNPDLWTTPLPEPLPVYPVKAEFDLSLDEFKAKIEKHHFKKLDENDDELMTVVYLELQKEDLTKIVRKTRKGVHGRYCRFSFEVYRRTGVLVSSKDISMIAIKTSYILRRALRTAICEIGLSPEGTETFLFDYLPDYVLFRNFRHCLKDFEAALYKERPSRDFVPYVKDLEDSDGEHEAAAEHPKVKKRDSSRRMGLQMYRNSMKNNSRYPCPTLARAVLLETLRYPELKESDERKETDEMRVMREKVAIRAWKRTGTLVSVFTVRVIQKQARDKLARVLEEMPDGLSGREAEDYLKENFELYGLILHKEDDSRRDVVPGEEDEHEPPTSNGASRKRKGGSPTGQTAAKQAIEDVDTYEEDCENPEVYNSEPAGPEANPGSQITQEQYNQAVAECSKENRAVAYIGEILSIIKLFPEVWKAPTPRTDAFNVVGLEIYRRHNVLFFYPETIKNVFMKAVKEFRQQIHMAAVVHGMDKKQTTSFLEKWALYQYFGYYREMMAEYEFEASETNFAKYDALAGTIKPDTAEPSADQILKTIRKFESVWRTPVNSITEQSLKEVGWEMYKRSGLYFSVKSIKSVFLEAVTLFRDHVHQSIVKFEHNEEQTTDYLQSWKYFKNFEYYRPMLKVYEDELRDKTQPQIKKEIVDDGYGNTDPRLRYTRAWCVERHFY